MNPLVAAGLRAVANSLPVDEAIALIGGGQDLFDDAGGILDDLLEQAGGLLPDLPQKTYSNRGNGTGARSCAFAYFWAGNSSRAGGIVGIRGAWLAAASTSLAVAGLMPVSAGAEAVAEYPPDLNARSFVTSDGGWEKASEATGLCDTEVTCPTVDSKFVPSGGTLGATDGYMATEVTGIAGIGSEARGVLRSPPFTYDGVAGVKPTEVALSVSHLAQVDPGISIVGNSVNFTVELVDVTAGEQAIRVIDAPLAKSDESWTAAPPASIPAGALTIGHHYRVRIITRFASGAQAFESGQVGYDDVRLVAIDNRPAPAAPDDDGGGKPGGGNAIFDGRNLWLNLKCFGLHSKVGSKDRCRVRATALAAKRGGRRYTFPVQRKVGAKKGKVVRARVRFQFRKTLETRRTVTLKSVIRANGEEKTVYKKLKLIKRRDR